MTGLKKSRGGFTSSKVTVDAWVPLKSTDKNEDWVTIWGEKQILHLMAKPTVIDYMNCNT